MFLFTATAAAGTVLDQVQGRWKGKTVSTMRVEIGPSTFYVVDLTATDHERTFTVKSEKGKALTIAVKPTDDGSKVEEMTITVVSSSEITITTKGKTKSYVRMGPDENMGGPATKKK